MRQVKADYLFAIRRGTVLGLSLILKKIKGSLGVNSLKWRFRHWWRGIHVLYPVVEFAEEVVAVECHEL